MRVNIPPRGTFFPYCLITTFSSVAINGGNYIKRTYFRTSPFAQSTIYTVVSIYFRIKETFIVTNHFYAIFRTNLLASSATTTHFFIFYDYWHFKIFLSTFLMNALQNESSFALTTYILQVLTHKHLVFS